MNINYKKKYYKYKLKYLTLKNQIGGNLEFELNGINYNIETDFINLYNYKNIDFSKLDCKQEQEVDRYKVYKCINSLNGNKLDYKNLDCFGNFDNNAYYCIQNQNLINKHTSYIIENENFIYSKLLETSLNKDLEELKEDDNILKLYNLNFKRLGQKQFNLKHPFKTEEEKKKWIEDLKENLKSLKIYKKLRNIKEIDDQLLQKFNSSKEKIIQNKLEEKTYKLINKLEQLIKSGKKYNLYISIGSNCSHYTGPNNFRCQKYQNNLPPILFKNDNEDDNKIIIIDDQINNYLKETDNIILCNFLWEDNCNLLIRKLREFINMNKTKNGKTVCFNFAKLSKEKSPFFKNLIESFYPEMPDFKTKSHYDIIKKTNSLYLDFVFSDDYKSIDDKNTFSLVLFNNLNYDFMDYKTFKFNMQKDGTKLNDIVNLNLDFYVDDTYFNIDKITF